MWVTARSERQVVVGHARVVHEREELRLDQEQVGDPLPFDRGEGGGGLELLLEDDGAAAEQGLVDEDLGEVGELAVGQLPALGRGRAGDRRRVAREGAPAALGHAGRPARGDHHGEVVGAGAAGQRGVRLGGGEGVEPGRDARHRPDGCDGGADRWEELGRLREHDDQPWRELRDHPGAALRVRRHRQVHRARPDEVRGVAHGQRIRAVGRQQGDEVAAADPEPVQRPCVPVDVGEQRGPGDVAAPVPQHGPRARRAQRLDQPLDVRRHDRPPLRLSCGQHHPRRSKTSPLIAVPPWSAVGGPCPFTTR